MRFLAVVQLPNAAAANVDVRLDGDRPTLAQIREIEQVMRDHTGYPGAVLINMIPLTEEG